MNTRQKIVAQARAWLGLCEPTSYLPILECYNNYARQHGLYVMTKSDPWCAMFASAVFIACGVPQIMPVEVSCPRMIAIAERRGLWIEDDNYLPSPGDLILYDWQDSGAGDNRGESDHVGIVCSISGSTIYVVEGNCSDAVREINRVRGQRYIRGYIVPDYAAVADPPDEDEAEPEKPKEKPQSGGIALPDLRRRDKGEVVRAAQFLLNGRDFSCGIWGADGDFGNMTEAAVLAFQRRNGLEADGVIGRVTWSYLLGLR